jgi:peptide deformylase
MVRKILGATDPKLRVVSKPVAKIDKKVQLLIKDLKETLSVQKDPEGVGLAAPQIGKNTRVFVMIDEGKIRALVNPKILEVIKPKAKTNPKKKSDIMEGCLSIPHYYGPLARSEKVRVYFLNEKGEKKQEIFSGFSAQIVQHEIDHLNGILFTDRLLEAKKPLYKMQGDEWEEVDFAKI